jgi:DNA-binding transcriptional ArsR family regulator
MKPAALDDVVRFADMFAAMGAESRVRIMQQLLSSHPEGMVVGEIQAILGLSGSNMSHHLDKLKNEGLVEVQREGTYLRCRANVTALQQLLSFLYSECCTRSKAINPNYFVKACRSARGGEAVEFRKAVKPR